MPKFFKQLYEFWAKSLFQKWAQRLGLIAALFGLVGLGGWLFDMPLLARGVGISPPISPPSALLIFLAGLAFTRGVQNRGATTAWRFLQGIALACGLNGILSRMEIPFLYTNQASPLDSQVLMFYG